MVKVLESKKCKALARRQANGAFSLSGLKPIGRNKRKHNENTVKPFPEIALSRMRVPMEKLQHLY